MSTIVRYRGDTAPDKFTVNLDGAPLDLTGCTFKLTVNSQKDPVDTSHQLLTVNGVVTDAAAGQVQFSQNATQADQAPGTYYYDVQMTDATSAIRTVVKGAYRFLQDITKT